MKLALDEAKKSEFDLPIGCVIEKEGEIIATGHNLKEKENDPTLHAEMVAIKKAAKKLNSWRLLGCNLYVTLEPCPMCAWAILNSQIKNVYFGAYDEKYGAFGSKLNLDKLYGKNIQIYGGIMEKECEEVLLSYFKKIRNSKQ